MSRLVDEAVTTHARFDITRNGKRAAVLMGADDYDSLVETLDVLGDAGLVRDIQKGLNDIEAGRTHSHAEVVADLRSRSKTPPR